MTKHFKAPVSQDLKIYEDDEVLGTLRVRPSAVLWKPKGAHSWYRLSIEKFGDYAVRKGTKKQR